MPDGLHLICGHLLDLRADCCPDGQSLRTLCPGAVQPVLNDQTAAIDRLTAIDELRAWLDDQVAMAVIGPRVAQATRAEMGATVGTSRQGAHNRWGATFNGTSRPLPPPHTDFDLSPAPATAPPGAGP